MRIFKNYFINISEIQFRDDKERYFDTPNNYRLGFGYGDLTGGIYNLDSGNGSGSGFLFGDGHHKYPHELIQYWEEYEKV